MKWIGITGSLGSGKSTVAEIIKSRGYPVLDADQMAREALGPGSPLLKVIQQRFGEEVFNAKGELDRKRLGQKVFNSKPDLLWLESLVHPQVQKQVKSLREKLERQGFKMAFYDVPLLFEKGLQKNFDQTIVVSSSLDSLMARVSARDGLSERDILSRLNNQIPLNEKEQKADHVILNDGSLDDLNAEVMQLLRRLETELT